MKKALLLIIGVLAFAAAGLIFAKTPQETNRVSPPEQTSVTPATGMMAYIDPATGEFTETPVMTDANMRSAVNTSSEGLVEVPSPLENGGTMVDLQGRFHHAAVMQLDDTGELTSSCGTTLPDAAHAHAHSVGPNGGESR